MTIEDGAIYKTIGSEFLLDLAELLEKEGPEFLATV